MPQLTKEQWQEIEQRLSGPFGRVEIKADGYHLTLLVGQYKPLRQCIVVFADGNARGEWLTGEAPEAKKFCREVRRWSYSAQQRAKARARLRSRRLDPFLRDFYQHVAEACSVYWLPHWFSPQSLTRHLRKTCADIEIVALGYRE